MASLAGVASGIGSGCDLPAQNSDGRVAKSKRMPAVYVPHGGGPWPFAELGFDKSELAALASYLRGLSSVTPTRPTALLVVSAHWEEAVPTVMTSPSPPMLYDYYGFPPETYAVQWPAPGSPSLAARVRSLLESAGFTTAEDASRGFDHGTFVPLALTYPDADVPTIQLSLKAGLAPAEHIAIGRALAPLRDEGVFIIGSGMSFHNMRGFRDPSLRSSASTFDEWLSKAVLAQPEVRATQLNEWVRAPQARLCHPREEHLLPLMVIVGAAAEDDGVLAFQGAVGRMPVSGYQFG
jgi:aromatic ring-opening dioxygenase catalytic subunit (LigB family)